jgi:drug/metabolite transporter (DMT)-like permease
VSEPRVPWQVKLAALCLVWGSSFLLMMVALRAYTPWQIVSVRIGLGAATLYLLLAGAKGRLPTGARVWAHLWVCGFFLAALPFSCFVWAETRIPSALAGISNSTTAITSVLAVAVLLPHQRTSGRKVLAVLTGFAGVVLVAHPWDLVGRPDPLGMGVALLGGASYGIGWTYNRRFLADADLGGLSQPTALVLTGTALIAPVGLLAWWLNRDAQPRPWSPQSDDYWLPLIAMIVLAVVNTGLAYMWQYDVVRGAGPVLSSTVTYLAPMVAVVLGVAVLGERLAPIQFVGFAIVLASAWVINSPERSKVREPGGSTSTA